MRAKAPSSGLRPHSIDTALAALNAAPMSRKKAMLLVLLIDAAIDAACPDGSDLLHHREQLATKDKSLALVMELAAMREGGPRLVVQQRDGAPASEAEYMVSLYNDLTLPRLMIVGHGEAQEALPMLRRAVAALAGT